MVLLGAEAVATPITKKRKERHMLARLNPPLFDDLFRSGATMNAITDVLLRKGKAASVRAFTITRTRSNQ